MAKADIPKRLVKPPKSTNRLERLIELLRILNTICDTSATAEISPVTLSFHGVYTGKAYKLLCACLKSYSDVLAKFGNGDIVASFTRSYNPVLDRETLGGTIKLARLAVGNATRMGIVRDGLRRKPKADALPTIKSDDEGLFRV